jgi:NADPH:quinone reductase-like Zn-dependent oxidoreductase
MKAAIVEHRGDAGAVKDVPVPQPAPHEILVRVTAAGVNPIDWKRRDDPSHLPLILGQDFAGMVSETGERVSKYRKGERIFGIARSHGAYAEYTVVPEDDKEQPIAKIPDDVGDADAAALPTAGLTALAALEALDVKKDTKLAILGATGGVGSFAVQMARDRGAHVIGTARSSNEQLARSLGVEEFVAYDAGAVTESIHAAHPGGIDAVLDLVDETDTMKRLAAVIRAGGHIASTIHSADVEWFAKHGIVAINLAVPNTPQSSHAGLRALLELLEQGRIRVLIAGERPLAEAPDALEESKSGTVDGKLVITVA